MYPRVCSRAYAGSYRRKSCPFLPREDPPQLDRPRRYHDSLQDDTYEHTKMCHQQLGPHKEGICWSRDDPVDCEASFSILRKTSECLRGLSATEQTSMRRDLVNWFRVKHSVELQSTYSPIIHHYTFVNHDLDIASLLYRKAGPLISDFCIPVLLPPTGMTGINPAPCRSSSKSLSHCSLPAPA